MGFKFSDSNDGCEGPQPSRERSILSAPDAIAGRIPGGRRSLGAVGPMSTLSGVN